ncbi:hypothetical protein [Geomicrobium sp. JCM 19039]|uniref:LuxE/PaaK family acyltransferase n=1 Tax=Geomicrobium sp. JCM 19039 TaxID=1460636 RepID=UPI00045F3BA1|nr:hypothetical protein [Geomicrobium sp. JCM 19039]GAK10737.1 long-chain-fatty-acid-luciferin-component ligase [Geomicrobium sp. JCM 19039]
MDDNASTLLPAQKCIFMEREEFDVIKTDVLNFLAGNEENEDTFNAIAISLFSHAYEHNKPYRSYCKKKGVVVAHVNTWRDIPAVSTDAFKTAELRTVPSQQCNRSFKTSGTTSEVQGVHYHEDLEVYDVSAIKSFRSFVGSERRPTAILFPHESNMMHSSLAHYLSLIRKEYGTWDSDHFITEEGYEHERFLSWLHAHRDQRRTF